MLSVGLGLSIVKSQSPAESAVGLWILAFNDWNDAGLWVDTGIWND